MTPRGWRKHLARAIIIDRATSQNTSLVGRIARARSEENYRFAAQFVAGKSVLDIGGGTGIGHDLLLAAGAVSLLSLDRHVVSAAADRDPRVRAVQGDFLHHPMPQGAFDVILCLGTLFYLADGEAALARMHLLLKPGGMLIVNCINAQLVRRYFAADLPQIDGKFSLAYDESGLRELLCRHFAAEPQLRVQQPVRVSSGLRGALAFWLTPLTWPFRRHPVIAKPPGTEGMYVYAIVSRNG